MSRQLKVITTTMVDVPEGASHFCGDLLDRPTFYKCTQVGVAGEHWWWYQTTTKTWFMASHFKPHWIEELPEDDEVHLL